MLIFSRYGKRDRNEIVACRFQTRNQRRIVEGHRHMKNGLFKTVTSAIGLFAVSATIAGTAQAADLKFSDIAIVSSSLPLTTPAGETAVTLATPATSDNLSYATKTDLKTNFGTLSLKDAQVVTGATGDHAIPFGISKTSPYVSVYTGGDAIFTFTEPVSAVSFDWGSIDTYNTLLVTTTKGQTLTITGSELTSDNGNQGSGGSDFIKITSALGDIQKLTLESNGIAFEAGNFAVSAVPLPAALPMFGLTLAGIGAMARRRARMQAVW